MRTNKYAKFLNFTRSLIFTIKNSKRSPIQEISSFSDHNIAQPDCNNFSSTVNMVIFY